VLGEGARHGGPQHRVDGERDGARLGDVEPAVLLSGEKLLDLGLQLVELGADSGFDVKEGGDGRRSRA
jgi:hypothetical protein